MKRSILSALCLGLVLAIPARAAETALVTWEEQVRAMGYLIMHLSSVNAINGINLSKQQATELRKMALDIEGSAARMPPLNGKYRADLEEVRDCYLEVRKLLLVAEEIPTALQLRVDKVRTIEATVIRQSLLYPVAGATNCLKCHGQPPQGDMRSAVLSSSPLKDSIKQPNPIEVHLAHNVGLFGLGGGLKLLGYVDKVDKLLQPEQKQAMSGFTCCITPPKSMTDPVRAGQAASGEREIELFRAVRKMNDVQWEVAKALGTDWVDRLIIYKNPGARPQEIAATRNKTVALLERVRKIPDGDFELDKSGLALELQRIAGTADGEQAEKDRKFTTATFLLVPGASEAYAAVIKRLDQRK